MRQKYPSPFSQTKLQPTAKTTQQLKPFFPETKLTFSLEIGRNSETETKNLNHGFGFGHEKGKGIFALSK